MKKIIVIGSIIAVVILVLASLPSVVGEQSTISKTPLLSKIRDRLLWEPGGFISDIILLIFILIWSLFGGPGAP